MSDEPASARTLRPHVPSLSAVAGVLTNGDAAHSAHASQQQPTTPSRSYALPPPVAGSKRPASLALKSPAAPSNSSRASLLQRGGSTEEDESESEAAASSAPSALAPLPAPTLAIDLQKGSAANRWMIFWSSVSLVIAVASMSATGPMFLYLQQRGISATLACCWRNQAMVLFLLLPALVEWFRMPPATRTWEAMRVSDDEPLVKESPREPPMSESARRVRSQEEQQLLYSFPTTAQIHVAPHVPAPAKKKAWHVSWYLLAVCVTWAGSLVLWVIALPYTSTPRASLFCSTYPLLLVPYMKYVQKIPVSAGEVLGVAISFAGILTTEVASMMDDAAPAAAVGKQLAGGVHVDAELVSSASSAGGFGSEWTSGQRQMFGDALCVCSSLLIGINILFAEKTRKLLPLFSYSCSSAVLVLLMLTAGAVAFEGSTWDAHPVTGVFGWVVGDMLYLNLAFGFVVGMIGVLGFNFAVKYVNPLIFSSTQLLDPGLTGLMSWMAGLEGWPSASTFIGVIIVSVGIGFITIYQHRREEQAKGPGAPGSTRNNKRQRGDSALRSPIFTPMLSP